MSLEVPRVVYEGLVPLARRLDESVVAQALPPRARTAHKGSNGHLLVIGGAPGMGGAVRLAGEAALRAGAGLVTVAAHPHSLGMVALRPELMSMALDSARDLGAMLARATVVALGPGLGQSPWARGDLRHGAGRRQAAGARCRCAEPAGAATAWRAPTGC